MEDEEAAKKAKQFIEATGLSEDGAEWLNAMDDEEREAVFSAVEILWVLLHQNTDSEVARPHDTQSLGEEIGNILADYLR